MQYHCNYENWSENELLASLKQEPVQQLKHLDIPADTAVLDFLGTLNLYEFTAADHFNIVTVLRSDYWENLQSHNVVDQQLLMIMINFTELIGSRFLNSYEPGVWTRADFWMLDAIVVARQGDYPEDTMQTLSRLDGLED